MALSLGGGSFINALMGRAGNVGQQRQKQQDQLMQMMMRGFVPTDTSQQDSQGKGLLSQLVGPTGALPLQSPKPMAPGDFEMAPWNPAEVSREEREARTQEAEDLRQHQITMEEQRFTNQQQLAQGDRDWAVTLGNLEQMKTEANMEAENEYRLARAKVDDVDALARLEKEYELKNANALANFERDKLLEGLKQENKQKYTAQDYMQLVQSLTEINTAISAADTMFKSAKEEQTYNALVKVRNEILAIMDKQTQGGADAVVGELKDALAGRANAATPVTGEARGVRPPTTQHQPVRRRN